MPKTPLPATEPPRDCQLCPRLVALRRSCREDHPDWWNAPVPAFGDPDAQLAIVGLAPGKQGANRTGRPFTGDFSGELLFSTLLKSGLAEGRYLGRVDDDLRLRGAIIVNAVKCLPPANKPLPQEIANCRSFLAGQLAALPRLRVLLALGRIAHETVLRHFSLSTARHPFAHGAVHRLPGGLTLVDSYHCSRYNQNTGRLTPEMFEAAVKSACQISSANRP